MFAQTGRLKNPPHVGNTPLARLTLGITGKDGKRAEIKFVRDDLTTDLVVQIPTAQTPTESTKTTEVAMN